MAGTARQAALAGLKAQRTRGTWPDQFVKKELAQFQLGRQDTALAVQLLYGTLQNYKLLDYYLAAYSSLKLNKVMPQVLDVLRLGAYQLLFLDRIPASAAVNESVRLARKAGGERAGGYANGLLRKLAAQKDALPEIDRGDFAQYLSIRYSHPQWFTQEMIELLGQEGAEALCNSNNQPPPVTARVNRLKTDAPGLIALLEQAGIAAQPHPWLPDCLVLPGGGNLAATELFAQGYYYLQDAASQLPPLALGIAPGQDVLDLCAAPGGKTLIAGQLQQGSGKLLALDLHEFKCKELQETARRYGLTNCQVRVNDSAILAPDLLESADRVICDVPCSGMGILRKKADIRFKTQEELAELPALQGKILDCAAAYCRPGGRVLYSTCTLLPQENQQVVQAFLERTPGFALEPLSLPGLGDEPGGMKTLYPHVDGTDGFFLACLRRSR